jgi:hypothetical protein
VRDSDSAPAAMDADAGGGGGGAAAAAEAERRRLAFVRLDAAGASFTCWRCGGVVAAARREEHERLWCGAG